MTPDDLDRLADEATPGPWAYEQIERGPAQVGLVWDDDDEPLSGAIVPDDGTVIECVAEVERGDDARLIALAPTLAREHAALLRWADQAREAMRGMSEDLEWVITEANPEHDGGYARLRIDEARRLLAALDAVTGG